MIVLKILHSFVFLVTLGTVYWAVEESPPPSVGAEGMEKAMSLLPPIFSQGMVCPRSKSHGHCTSNIHTKDRVWLQCQ